MTYFRLAAQFKDGWCRELEGREEWRNGGMEGGRDGGTEGRRDGGTEGGRE